VALHDSPAGRRYGRANGDLTVTDALSSRLIRLPMWVGLEEPDQNRVGDALTRILTLRA
jgi:dTDP-4-amino-4,6-dideoxygalactose transaminase